jgi:hypothetical protein
MLLAVNLATRTLARMCPACLASLGLLFASATGAGGLTALVVGTFLPKKKNRCTKEWVRHHDKY